MADWQRGVLHLGRDLLVIWGVLLIVLWAAQDRLIYPAPAARQPWGALTVQRPDGVLRGWVSHPEARDALVVFGGNAMAISALGPYLDQCSTRAIYLVPYRGYEGQWGHPRENDLVADGQALMAQVKSHHANVAILGISLGTGIATQVAVTQRPDRLVLVTPYANLQEVADHHFYGLPIHWLMKDRYDSVGAATRLTGVPVTVLQATHDEVIPARSTAALIRAFPQPPQLVQVRSSHNGILNQAAFCKAVADLDPTRPPGVVD